MSALHNFTITIIYYTHLKGITDYMNIGSVQLHTVAVCGILFNGHVIIKYGAR